MWIEAHYDRDADIVWVRFERYDPSTVVGERTTAGLREVNLKTGEIVGLEFWHASRDLPADLLRMLPSPKDDVLTSSLRLSG